MASTLPRSTDHLPRASSLERRLSLMISGLLFVTIAAFGIVAFNEIRQTSTAAAHAQLKTVLAQFVESVGRGLTARFAVMTRISADSLMVAAAKSPHDSAAVAAAHALLLSHRTPADSLVVTQGIVSGDETTNLIGSLALSAIDKSEMDSALKASIRGDTATIGVFFRSGDEARYWITAPIHSASIRVGTMVELRRLGGGVAVEKQIKALTGQNFRVYFATTRGDVWIARLQEPIAPYFDVRVVPDSFHVTPPRGEPLIGFKARVRGTPWVLLFTTAESAVDAPAYAFLRDMAWIALVLVPLALLGAQLVSRRVTQPLHSLSVAAMAIADGDFGRRESPGSNDEIGQLASAFNTMAERIGTSYEQLERRMIESQLLASELQQRNAELLMAQREATEAKVASDRARAEAQRANAAKSEFLAMMSHELRTPLSAIAGYAEILQLGIRGALNPAQQSDLTRIQANQAHLLRIINDILDLTQVESGLLLLDLQPTPLAEVIAMVESIVRPVVTDRGVELRLPTIAEDLCVSADRARLTQVLVNLIANSARFTPPGGFAQVWIETDTRLRLHVTDSGMGIAPEHQEQVFLPFVQADSSASRRAEGTGLGLAISRRLVEAMGGTLTLASRLGEGSTFTVELALAGSAAQRATDTDRTRATAHS